MMPSVAFVLPNYCGRELLERFLPSVLRAAEAAATQVIVVDDASTDDSVPFLRSAFPSVQVIPLPTNVGFARTVNAGVEAAEADIIVALNTDVQPQPDFLPPLLRALEQPDVFAAVPRIRRPLQGGVAESAIAGEFRRGLFRLRFLGDAPFAARPEPFPTLYPVLAAAAVRRDLYLQFGGLDDLFAPYYWEDADLGYRAWRAGYRVLCVPGSIVDHHAGSISQTQPPDRVVLAQDANRFLFTWKNLHDPRWTLAHWLMLGPHCALSLCTGRARFVRGLLAALPRLPKALRQRRRALLLARIPDREAIRRANPFAS